MLQFQPWKIILILVVLVAGAIQAFPNLFSREQVAGPSGRFASAA